jgi:hypothetical protein
MAKDEPNLFGVSPSKRKKAPPAPNGAMTRLIGQYKAGYVARFSEPPVFTPRDSSLLKKLVMQFGEDLVKHRLALYLRWDDRFAEESGYSISTLYSSWPRLTALAKRKEPASRVPSVEATKAYLEKNRKARDDG